MYILPLPPATHGQLQGVCQFSECVCPHPGAGPATLSEELPQSHTYQPRSAGCQGHHLLRPLSMTAGEPDFTVTVLKPRFVPFDILESSREGR